MTKTYGPDAAVAAWDAGIKDVGENRVQEAVSKMAAVSVALRWHLIGHLQRNKVKQLDGFHLVHSMDSARLADALDAHGRARGRPVDVLLQVNVSGEGTKGGYEPADVEREAERLARMTGLVVRGVMTMAPFDGERGDAAEGVQWGARIRGEAACGRACRRRSCRWGCRVIT